MHFLLMLSLAFAGGLILNLMPCVLPVLSLKIFDFVQKSGSRRSVIFAHGLSFTAGTLVYVYQRQREMIAALRRAREKIQLEETRVFDFLHGLGAALTASSKPADLHVLILAREASRGGR